MRARMALALALTLTVAGCGKSGPPPPPVAIEPSELDSKVYWSSDLDDHRITLDGYIGFDNGPTGHAIALGPELTSQPFGRGDALISFDLEQGDQPNQMQLPEVERHTLQGVPAAPAVVIVDVAHATFKDAAGQAHSFDEKVRVTGRLSYAGFGSNLMTDEDARSPNGRRFKPRLIDVSLESLGR